jgi:hypothetical protein
LHQPVWNPPAEVAELTKVTFTLEVPETLLTNLVLQPLVSEEKEEAAR